MAVRSAAILRNVNATPFLQQACAWLYRGEPPATCGECGFRWSIGPEGAVQEIQRVSHAVTAVLHGRDGMRQPPDGGWNATAYVWHLTDLARGWSERWVQLAAAPGATLVPWDPDVLADARNYRNLPTAAALWALPAATDAFAELLGGIKPDTPFLHADWGEGNVGDATRWIAHEFVHHLADVERLVA